MAKKKTPGSADLKDVLKRVRSSELKSADKAVLSDILGHAIALKQLLEKSKGGSSTSKKVIASLPFGFDIVK